MPTFDLHPQKTEAQLKHEFFLYFRDLEDEAEEGGWEVSRSEEWENFIHEGIKEGDLPESARNWQLD